MEEAEKLTDKLGSFWAFRLFSPANTHQKYLTKNFWLIKNEVN